MALVSGYGWKAGSTKQVIFSKSGFTPDGHIHEIYAREDGTWKHADLTQLTSAPAGPFTSDRIGYDWEAGGTKQVVYKRPNGAPSDIYEIHELYARKGGTWKHVNLTALAGADLAYKGALAAYPWNAGGTKQVVYQGGNLHIKELYVATGGSWKPADLTQLAGAPVPMDDVVLVAFEWPAAVTKQVVYVDQGVFHELFVEKGGSWKHANLTALTGAPPPQPGTDMCGFAWNAGGTKQVMYVSGGHIHELYVEKGGTWKHADLTSLTGAPPFIDPSNVSFNAYAWEAGNAKQVVYVNQANNHIHELYVTKGGSWKHADLTQMAGALPVAGTAGASPFGYEWVLGGSKHVVYPTGDGHIHELSASKSSGWMDTDLTALSGAPTIY